MAVELESKSRFVSPNDIIKDGAFQRMIRESMEKEVGRIVEEEAAAAKSRVEMRVVSMKGELAARMSKNIRFQTGYNPNDPLVRAQIIVEF